MTEFKEFKVGDIFTYESIPQIPKGFTPDKYKEGIPYITQTKDNNGVTAYIKETNILRKIEGNILVLGVDTASSGVVYWQEGDFYGNKLVGLRSLYANKTNIQYIISCLLKIYTQMYNYTYKISMKIILETIIELPVKSLTDTEPDWDYMEQYIKQIEKKAILLVKEQNEKDIVLLKELVGQEEGSDISEDVELVPLKVGDIFNINTGGDLILGKTTEGKIPVVSHQNSNNGVSKRVSKIFERTIFDCKTTIALADRGTFFASVQQEDFYIGTRVKALSIKNKDIVTKNILLYLATSINKHSVIFEKYSDNATSKLPELEIYLPVNKNASELVPDWTTIEDYMKHIQQKYILLKEQQNEEELANLFKFTGLNEALLLSGNEQDC